MNELIINEQIKKEVTEDYQSALYGYKGVLSGLNILQGVVNGEYAYLFKKKKNTSFDSGLKVFRECHERCPNASFYHSVGVFEEEQSVGLKMETLVSVEGEPKQTFPLASKDFANFHLLKQLNREENMINSNGRMMFKCNKRTQATIDLWRSILGYLKFGPMHYVLEDYFSKNDLQRIENASPSELGRFIAELENFGTGKVRTIKQEDYFPLLAKGLTGFSKAIKRRRQMRVEFWLAWANCRRDLKAFAKEFNHPETRNWEWKYD